MNIKSDSLCEPVLQFRCRSGADIWQCLNDAFHISYTNAIIVQFEHNDRFYKVDAPYTVQATLRHIEPVK
jgi:hypothetical protein